MTDDTHPGGALYRFGPFTLDLARLELRKNGQLRPLEPQVFSLLTLLVEARDRVVGHDELIRVIWKGRVVSDAAVNSRISAARTAVDDDGRTQSVIRTFPRRGFRFIAPVEATLPTSPATTAAGHEPPPSLDAPTPDTRRIAFCRSADGTQLAYARFGNGPPLVKVGHWLTHLELDWAGGLWRPLLDALGRHYTVVHYDQRGNGLSDWDADDLSLDAFVNDLEAVIDAAGIDDFVLYGTSQGAPVSVAYAVRHPKRVSRLILQGGFAQGRLRRSQPAEREKAEAFLTLMRHGWGMEGSQFIQAFSSVYVPDATPAQISAFVSLQRHSTSADNAIRLRRAIDEFDISDLLPRVTTPATVIHARNDAVHPLDQGRLLACSIPGASYRELDSRNHVILEHDPAWPELLACLGTNG